MRSCIEYKRGSVKVEKGYFSSNHMFRRNRFRRSFVFSLGLSTIPLSMVFNHVAGGFTSRCASLVLKAPHLPCHCQTYTVYRKFRLTYSTSTGTTTSKPPQYGQPITGTHPHLFRSDELTPGIPFEEYEDRRRRLMQSLPEGSVVICMGGTVKLMTQGMLESFKIYCSTFNVD